jgi:hypothetical protein
MRESRCATCGKPVDDSGVRFGRTVFCSRYCQLQHEVAVRAKPHGPPVLARAGRRLGHGLKLALALVALVVIAFVIALVLRSTGSNPVAVGQTKTIGDWTVRVRSANFNAASAPSKAREIEVTVILGYHGPAEGRLPFGFYVKGTSAVPYMATGTCSGPGQDLDEQRTVPGSIELFSGASEPVHGCFQVAENDLSNLRLYVQTGASSSVAFTLRSD